MKRNITKTAGSLMISSALLCSMTVADAIAVTTPAYEVLPGCALPSAPRQAFFVDPVNGLDTNDGTEARPWKSLQTVLNSKVATFNSAGVARNATAPVKGGDIIYLKSGDYGAIKTSYMVNKDFITVTAAPNSKPLIKGWTAYNGFSKWVLRGLTFEGSVTIRGDAVGTHDVILTENRLGGPDAAEHWTPEQWSTLTTNGSHVEGFCTSQVRNTVKFVGFGIAVGGDKVLVKNNLVDFYWGDGIRFFGTNMELRNNYVLNHYGKTGSANHNDGMQGWKLDGIPSENLVLDGNVVIETTNKYKEIPAIPTGEGSDYIQGISIFDGAWKNIRVTNNVSIGSAYHGLSFYGVDGGYVANNTVLSSLPDRKRPFWLGIFNRKDGTPPRNVVVRNNIANAFPLASGTGVVSEYNLLAYDPIASRPKDPGIDPKLLFVKWDRSTAGYDVHLKAGTVAVGKGFRDVLSPTFDADLKPHNNPIDLGAYAYQSPVVDQPKPTTPTTPTTPNQPGTGGGSLDPVTGSGSVVSGPIKHTVVFKANARLTTKEGIPNMILTVDGQYAGKVAVNADTHIGQVGTYTFDFGTQTQPKKIALTLDGYLPTEQKYVALGVFNVAYGPTGKRGVDVLRTMDVSTMTTGKGWISRNGDGFTTKGTTIEWDVSKQQ